MPDPLPWGHRPAQRLGTPPHNAGSVRVLTARLVLGSRRGEAESREGRRQGEHHQLQDFLLSWLRFPCLYIAPSCHSLWAHSWEETAGRTDGEDAGLCPAEPGWLPASAQTAARLATSRLDTKLSSPRKHGSPRPAHAATAMHLPGTPVQTAVSGRAWAVGDFPVCVMKLLTVLSYIPASVQTQAGGAAGGWFVAICNMNLSREAAEPRDCPDPKAGSTGSAGCASGWPCPVC